MGSFSYAPIPRFERTMIFIDGGYLRENMKRIYDDDKVNFTILHRELTSKIIEAMIHPYLVRVYYYDALPEVNDDRYTEDSEYFKRIKEIDFYEVRTAILKKKKEGYKQVGADVLLAVDMLRKAYENHYEWAILLAGDGDFMPVVQAVKDTGKRVYGFYFENHVSKELMEAFDSTHPITREISDSLRPSEHCA